MNQAFRSASPTSVADFDQVFSRSTMMIWIRHPIVRRRVCYDVDATIRRLNWMSARLGFDEQTCFEMISTLTDVRNGIPAHVAGMWWDLGDRFMLEDVTRVTEALSVEEWWHRYGCRYTIPVTAHMQLDRD